jgi:hypothetical protein
MQAVPLPRNEVSFQHKGRELTRLLAGGDLMRPFLYPIAGPAGRSLTRMGHPRDPVSHSHHNSVWISHQNAGGTNFWEDREGDGSGRIVAQRIQRLWDAPDRCGCTFPANWTRTGAQPAVLLKELRSIEAWSPQEDGSWLLVLESTFSAPGSEAVELAQSGFGMIGVRMAKTIGVRDGGGSIRNDSGGRNEAGCFRKPAKWVDYSGPVTDEASGGIALFDHPKNPGHPTAFHVRDDGWMGVCLTPAGALKVEPSAPLTVRYGIWAHAGMPEPGKIDQEFQRFCGLGELGAVDKVGK